MKKGVWQIGDGVGGWALGIAGLAMLVIPTLFYFSNDQSYSNAAQHATRVSNAAEKFISDNAATISAGATPTAPYVFNTQTLIDNGYLPTGFAPKNTFSQDYQIRVLEPTANKFQTLVVTINGQALSDSAARKIATRIGADGGFVDKGIAKGSLGAWTQDLAAFGVSPGNGHIAIAQFYKNTVSSNDYLYRKSVPGHPELNTMSTALNMGGNDVSHAKNIDASGNVISSATVQGAAVNSTGNMTATGTVTAQTTNTAGETYTGGWFRTRGDTGWYSEKWGGGFHMTDSSWIRAYQDKGIYTGGQVQAGTVQSNGRMTANEFLQINGVATAGWGCSPNGLVGRDAAGGILSCQSGVWKNSDFIVQLGTNGWSCNPRSGLIEQWGKGSGLGTDSSRYETFTHNMTAVFSATVTAINTPKNGVRGGDMGVYNLSTQGMFVTNDDYPIEGYFWRVIGYSLVC
ncbi:shufflon system plasmid conjugative transfer pilus tip adhesin PilV [Salmonella enterica subsp. enterica serovar Infantis]|nr:shufflon system plasmid conjugative transfer pilus tip adhesin PilV [Salmonella enterica subsp. enterica serovar Infantis]